MLCCYIVKLQSLHFQDNFIWRPIASCHPGVSHCICGWASMAPKIGSKTSGGKSMTLKGIALKRSAPKSIGLDLAMFRKAMKEDCFTSTTSLFCKVKFANFPKYQYVGTGLWPHMTRETNALLALLVFVKYRAIQCYKKCPVCKKGVKLLQSHRKDTNTDRYQWVCAGYQSKDCWQCNVTKDGILDRMRANNWLPFLHFVVMMKGNYRMAKIGAQRPPGY